ncbi:TPA: hypothetical protein DCX16_06350 [bacterium]|nr:hypothetical protein [bacterium]
MEEERKDEEDIVEKLAKEFLLDMEKEKISDEEEPVLEEKPAVPKEEEFISVPEKEPFVFPPLEEIPTPTYEEPFFKEEPEEPILPKEELYPPIYEKPKEEPIQPTYEEMPSTEKIEEILASIEEEEKGVTWPKEGVLMEKEEEEEEIEEKFIPSEEELLVKRRPIRRRKRPSRLLKFAIIGCLFGGILGFGFYFGMRHFQPIINFVNIGFINKILKPSCSITISSYPSDANVFLDDILKGMTPLTIPKLSFGDYNIKIEKEGFRPFVKVINVNTKEPMDIVAHLEPMVLPEVEEELVIGTGTLIVRPNPKDARIYIDGKISKIPIFLSSGIHSIKVQKEGFSVFARNVEIKEGEVIEISANLSPLFGNLLIDSIPRGGYVFFEEKEVGKTPVIIPSLVPWKPYNVEIRMEGFSPWRGKTFVEPNQRTKIMALLKRMDLKEELYYPRERIIYEKPYEKEEIVRFIPKKPLIREPEVISKELLELKKTIEEFKKMPSPTISYPFFTQEYEPVKAEIPSPLPKKPKPMPEIVTGPSVCFITSIPPGAEIFLDGKPIGKTPIRSFMIEGGKHRLKAVLAGYKGEEREVLVNSKETNFFNFSLTKK